MDKLIGDHIIADHLFRLLKKTSHDIRGVYHPAENFRYAVWSDYPEGRRESLPDRGRGLLNSILSSSLHAICFAGDDDLQSSSKRGEYVWHREESTSPSPYDSATSIRFCPFRDGPTRSAFIFSQGPSIFAVVVDFHPWDYCTDGHSYCFVGDPQAKSSVRAKLCETFNRLSPINQKSIREWHPHLESSFVSKAPLCQSSIPNIAKNLPIRTESIVVEEKLQIEKS